MASPPHSPSHILSPPINRVPLPAVPILAKTKIGIYQLVNGLISRVCKPNTCPCPACESGQSLVSIYFLIRLVSRQFRMRRPSFPSLVSPPQSDRLWSRGKKVDKILSATKRLLPPTAFQSFSVCHKNWPQYFPFVAPRLPISLARLRIKLCHVLQPLFSPYKLCPALLS